MTSKEPPTKRPKLVGDLPLSAGLVVKERRQEPERPMQQQRLLPPAPIGPRCWSNSMTTELISSGIAPFLPVENRARGLFGLCVVAGRHLAGSIRQEYLRDNDGFLLQTYGIHDVFMDERRTKMLAWMKINANWAGRCKKEVRYSSIVIGNAEEFEKLDLVELPQGGIIYRGGAVDSEGTPKSGDILIKYKYHPGSPHYLASAPVTKEDMIYILSTFPDESVSLRFASDVNFIFNDPATAVLFGVRELLEGAMDGKAENERVCEDVWRRIAGYSRRQRPDMECFKYLLTLPGVRCRAPQLLEIILDEEDEISLRALLEEKIVDINAHLNTRNKTPLHLLCNYLNILPRCSYKENLRKLKLLLEFSADPTIADVRGNLPVDTLRASASTSAKEYPEFKEMVALLEGKRDTE